MIDRKQLEETREVLDGVMTRWAPFPSEPQDIRMMRSLLHLHAYEKDVERCLKGETPIRTDYPLPLPDRLPEAIASLRKCMAWLDAVRESDDLITEVGPLSRDAAEARRIVEAWDAAQRVDPEPVVESTDSGHDTTGAGN